MFSFDKKSFLSSQKNTSMNKNLEKTFKRNSLEDGKKNLEEHCNKLLTLQNRFLYEVHLQTFSQT